MSEQGRIQQGSHQADHQSGGQVRKKKRVHRSAAQIVECLREADALLRAGRTVGQVIQQLGIGESTYYKWREKYGGMQASEARRLQELERENARLKKLVAEAELDKQMLKEVISQVESGKL
jgi:transposase-like protein